MAKSLFVLPFDHRGSFTKKLFNVQGRELTEDELKKAKELKQIIYHGFELAIKNNAVPRESAAILIDEQFGGEIIQDAVSKHYTVCVCVEKSGQDEFDFEYGNDFGGHLNKYRPAFAKALVRYNPDDDQELNSRQRARLKELNDFCIKEGYKFIIEPLVPATKNQLAQINNDQNRYDNEVRPKLMMKMIAELQKDGIEPDVWKIEGLENSKDYQDLVMQIKSNSRQADAIVLGRGADADQVEKWLIAGAKVPGIIGFAIGRTIFWQSLLDHKDGKISKDEAVSQIAQKYQHFYRVFDEARQ
jgi:myo-inositol catabolism protein IolC